MSGRNIDDLMSEARYTQRRYFENLWEICKCDIDTAICYFNITRENAVLLSTLSIEQLKEFENFTIPILQPKTQKHRDSLKSLLMALIEGDPEKLKLSFSSFVL